MHIFRFTKEDWFSILLIFMLSALTVADLFLTPGRSANMDGIVHTMTPNLFYYAMKGGEFPITWIDGFANYGLPLGIIAHQLTTYLTAFFQFIVADPVVAFNIVAFLGFFLSTAFFYVFLRIYFLPIPAFVASVLFHFAPYRILNIYIRGAMPEFFAAVFIPPLLIGLYLFIEKKNIKGAFLVSLSILGIALTHPFMLVISAFLAVPYGLFLLLTNGVVSFSQALKRKNIVLFTILGGISLVGLGMAGYFVVPLLFEIKYFYYGLSANHLTPNNFLGLPHFFDPNWYYFTAIDVLSRGFVIQVGLIETLFVICGVLLSVFFITKRNRDILASLLVFSSITAVLIIFFMLSVSEVFYRVIPVLSGIQFPWRLLSAFLFLPPIISAYFFSRMRSIHLLLLVIFIVCIFRFPQLYGKNYVRYSDQFYRFTPLNLHATVMNPIWTGRSEDYPVKRQKAAFVEGSGDIAVGKISNALRQYTITTADNAKLADHTFYFPGWKVFVDGNEVPIEFQDPEYRRVITYAIPKGRHDVVLRFEDTKVRWTGKMITFASTFFFITLLIFKRRLQRLLAE